MPLSLARRHSRRKEFFVAMCMTVAFASSPSPHKSFLDMMSVTIAFTPLTFL